MVDKNLTVRIPICNNFQLYDKISLKMDKKTVGENIVNDIINSYILSDDFKVDAVHYVYKRIFDEYNSRIADCGHYFEFNAFDEGGILKPEVAKEFQDKMEVLTNERNMFRQIFDKVFNYSPDYNETVPLEFNIIMGKK